MDKHKESMQSYQRAAAPVFEKFEEKELWEERDGQAWLSDYLLKVENTMGKRQSLIGYLWV
jgi:hypothetical protein